MTMLDHLFDLGYWSIEGFWLPLLVWTVAALPVAVFLLFGRRGAVLVRYTLAMALLTALPIGLIAVHLIPGSGQTASPLGLISLPSPVVEPHTVSLSDPALQWTTIHWAGLLFFIAVLAACWRITMLLVEFARLLTVQRLVSNGVDSSIQDLAAPLTAQLGITRRVHVALSSTARTPMTFGWLHPVVILPARLKDTPEDLRLALIHELIHVRRHDYLLQWFEQVIGALFVVHPIVAALRREASLLRESSCDADLVRLFGDRARYARLLYHFSKSGGSPWTVAVGISLRKHHLRRRITAMKDATDYTRRISALRIGLILAVMIFGLSAMVVACSETLIVDESPATDPLATDSALETGTQDEDVYVVVEEMPELVGGLKSIQENLFYPELAAQAGIEGRVIIQFVVDEQGAVRTPKVVRGVGSGLDEAALNAVENATFLPGKQRGEPVKVKMSLPVTFKLPGNGEDAPAGADRPDSDTEAGRDVTMPELIGGLESIQQRLRYPENAWQARVEGRVIIQLTIDKEGFVTDAEVIRGAGHGLDEEALRVGRSARFTPGAIDGEPTETKLSLPITFKLSPSSQTPTGALNRQDG